MKKTLIAVCTLTIALSACAEGDATSEAPASSTVPTTSVATTTSATTQPADTAPATTTDPEPATTTTTAALPQLDADVEAFLASLEDAAEVTSARIEGVIEMKGLEAGDAGVTDAAIVFGAAFDAASGNSSFLMDMSSLAGTIETDPDDPFAGFAEGFAGTMEVRQIGDRAYMQFPLFTLMFGAETTWVSMPADEGGSFSEDFQAVPSDPRDVLDAYAGAKATIENLGEESVNGVVATHYRITYDVAALADDLSADERAELEASGIFADGVVPVDVWVTPEGHTVRMVLEIDGSTVDAPPGEGFASMTVRYDLFDINQPITIEVPPASDVTPIEELEAAFDFDFGTEA